MNIPPQALAELKEAINALVIARDKLDDQVDIYPFRTTRTDPVAIADFQDELHQWAKDSLSDAPVEQWLAIATAMEQEATAIRRKCAGRV